MPTFSDEQFDLILTDPPYNVGFKYEGYDDKRPEEEYREWLRAWFAQAQRVSHSQIIFPGNHNLHIWYLFARPSGVGCWYKPGSPSHGGFARFGEWEPFLVYNRTMSGSNVIRSPIARQEVEDFGCPKPLHLIDRLVMKTKPTTLLDTFAGSGTTLLIGKYRGVPTTGIEQASHHCGIIRRRVLDFQKTGKLKIQ